MKDFGSNPFTTLSWEKFFSLFGIVICLLAFLVAGTISEAVHPNTYAVGGMFALAVATILIYGFVFGLSLILLGGLAAYGLDPRLVYACEAGIVTAVIFVFATEYTPPFPKLFWNWVRARTVGTRIP